MPPGYFLRWYESFLEFIYYTVRKGRMFFMIFFSLGTHNVSLYHWQGGIFRLSHGKSSMIYKYNSPRITAFLPSMIGIVITDSIIFLSHCPTKLFIQQPKLTSKTRQSLICRKMPLKNSLVVQTQPRMYMTSHKVLMIEGGKKWNWNKNTSWEGV